MATVSIYDKNTGNSYTLAVDLAQGAINGVTEGRYKYYITLTTTARDTEGHAVKMRYLDDSSIRVPVAGSSSESSNPDASGDISRMVSQRITDILYDITGHYASSSSSSKSSSSMSSSSSSLCPYSLVAGNTVTMTCWNNLVTFTGGVGTTGYVVVNGVSYQVANQGGFFAWDSDNAQGGYHLFSSVGESIFRTALGFPFSITWNGFGSLVFRIDMEESSSSLSSDSSVSSGSSLSSRSSSSVSSQTSASSQSTVSSQSSMSSSGSSSSSVSSQTSLSSVSSVSSASSPSSVSSSSVSSSSFSSSSSIVFPFHLCARTVPMLYPSMVSTYTKTGSWFGGFPIYTAIYLGVPYWLYWYGGSMGSRWYLLDNIPGVGVEYAYQTVPGTVPVGPFTGLLIDSGNTYAGECSSESSPSSVSSQSSPSSSSSSSRSSSSYSSSSSSVSSSSSSSSTQVRSSSSSSLSSSTSQSSPSTMVMSSSQSGSSQSSQSSSSFSSTSSGCCVTGWTGSSAAFTNWTLNGVRQYLGICQPLVTVTNASGYQIVHVDGQEGGGKYAEGFIDENTPGTITLSAVGGSAISGSVDWDGTKTNNGWTLSCP